MVEIKLLDLVEKPHAISRRFVVPSDSPIIGRLLISGVVDGMTRNGFIETTTPCPSEISLVTTYEPDLNADIVLADDRCIRLINMKLHASGHFTPAILPPRLGYVSHRDL